MSKLYTIVAVPDLCEDEVPYSYEENGLIRWVDEVFMEGYKKPDDEPLPSLEKCLALLEGAGYTVEVTDEPLNPEQLRDKYRHPDGNQWGECPEFPREDWQYEVANGDTSQGYWEWLEHAIEMAAEEVKDA